MTSILPELQAVVNSILSAEAVASAQVRAEEYADWLIDEFDQWVDEQNAYYNDRDSFSNLDYCEYETMFISTKWK